VQAIEGEKKKKRGKIIEKGGIGRRRRQPRFSSFFDYGWSRVKVGGKEKKKRPGEGRKREGGGGGRKCLAVKFFCPGVKRKLKATGKKTSVPPSFSDRESRREKRGGEKIRGKRDGRGKGDQKLVSILSSNKNKEKRKKRKGEGECKGEIRGIRIVRSFKFLASALERKREKRRGKGGTTKEKERGFRKKSFPSTPPQN